jgi:hypothetical protein
MDNTPFHFGYSGNRVGHRVTANWAVIRSPIEYPTMRLPKPPVFHCAEVKFALIGGILRESDNHNWLGPEVNTSRLELTLHKIVSNSGAWRFP